MAKNESKALSTEVNEDTLAALRESYPVEQGGQRIMLPRLGMISQDKTEETGKGKDKKIKVIAAAGEFYIDRPTDEEDEDGKKVWDRTELGDTIEVVILFQRKQLKMFDEATEQYTSSPIYDNDDEVIPLFCDKSEVGRGTPAELKAKYQFTDEKDGKVKSKLEENRILYVEHEGEVYQMNLRGSSMYSFLTFARKVVPPSVITTLSSEPMEKGSISWNKMTFTPKRKITQAEAEVIVQKVRDIKDAIRMEKAQFVNVERSKSDADKEFEKF